MVHQNPVEDQAAAHCKITLMASRTRQPREREREEKRRKRRKQEVRRNEKRRKKKGDRRGKGEGGVFLLVYRLVESIYLLCLAVSRLKGV